MKEEASIKWRVSALAVAAIMLLTVFGPAAFASAETTEAERRPAESAEAGAAQAEAKQEDTMQAGTDETAAQRQTAKPASATIASVRIASPGSKMTAGKKISLRAAIHPSTAAQQVSWSSSNDEIASVTSAGQVHAKKPGTVSIKAAAGGKTDAYTIKVGLSKPTGVKTKTLGTKSIQVKWRKVSGASGYKIYRATSKNGKYKKVATVKGGKKTSYTNKNRTTGKTYYYKIKAYNGKYHSSFSKKVSGKARPVKTTVKATAGEEKVKVSWKKVSGSQGYHIYRAASKKGKYARIKTVNSNKKTSFTNSDLKAGKTYFYKVRAYKKVKGKKIFAAYSAPVSAKAKKIKLKTSKKGFQYKKKFTVKCYAYSGGGRTAMGTRARAGAIAVDPKVIPLGTKVYVEGYGYARAEDTGGNIKGRKVDLYMNSTGSCYKWGVKFKTIYVGVRK